MTQTGGLRSVHCQVKPVLQPMTAALRNDNPALQENCPQLVQSSSLSNNPITSAMKVLHIQLLFFLDLNESHSWPRGCFCYSLRITIIVFLGP
ncbi:hypothetical protein AM571_PA00370 (plasmid) [Rhizobium etli 8C-3]|uniref:Uncharacterized protein n=1 Tax=Rhizobium etli 8C-3 TaxID=538025 RepID=A0A1L5PAS0_RHIET|nr:hypothetical protein AM571_PA00370 [Rhizobium etli 8C-3]